MKFSYCTILYFQPSKIFAEKNGLNQIMICIRNNLLDLNPCALFIHNFQSLHFFSFLRVKVVNNYVGIYDKDTFLLLVLFVTFVLYTCMNICV